MSEDYVLSADILLNPQSDRAVAAVQSPDGSWTALAVVAGTGLVHVIRDSNSHSGWNSAPVANGSAVLEVVTGIDALGTSHAFYQDGSQTCHISLAADGTWSSPDQFPLSQNLGVAYVPLFGEIVAYGITVKGDLLLMQKNPSGPGWQGAVCDINGGLQGGQAVLSMSNSEAWTLGAAVGGKFELFTGRGTNLASGPQVVSTPNSVPRVHFAYEHLNSTMFMFSDDKNSLYTSVAFSDNIQQIPRSQVVQGTGIVDANHLVHFYAADPTGKMWVLHQTAWDSNSAPVWAHMFPLDVNVAQVASPFQRMEGKVLFAAGVDQTLHILTQNPVSQRWTRTKLQNPSAKVPYHLTRYRTQLTAADQYTNPAANVPLTITASAETEILASGKTYLIGPGQSATLNTDATGVLTITRTATSLVTPQYTVTAAALANPLTVYPDAQYHSFLSGSSSINTGSSVVPPMSADTLKAATVNGQPLAPKLSITNAKLAAQGIVSGMQSVPGSSSALRAASRAGWALDFRDPQNGQFLNFATTAELNAYLAGLGGGGAAAFPSAIVVGDFWNDIAQFFGDIWHAIESAAMAVVDWVVNTIESVISFVVKIGEDLIQLAALAIKTIEDAIPFIHAIFNFIGALVDKVLDWVKDLIGWDDIWKTKKAFEHYVLGGIPSLENFLEYSAPLKVNHFFGKLKSDIDAELIKVSASLRGQSIGSLGTSSSSVLTRAHRLKVTASSNPSQSNWVLSKVKENVGSSVLAPLTSNPPKNIIDAFWDALGNPTVMGDLNAALASLSDFFKLAFTNPQQFQKQGASDLVDGVRDVIDWGLDFLDQFIDNMLAVLAASLTGLRDILSQSLGDIPIVSWLYTNVICPNDQKEPLTILRACCLILAFPVTLAYKLAHNMQPPFSISDVEAIRAASAEAGNDRRGLGAALQLGSPTVVNEVILYLSFLQGCADVATDASSVEETSDFFNLVTGWLDLAVNFVMQVLSWPGQIFSFSWDWDSFTPGQTLSRAAWLMSWALVLANGLMMTQPNPQGGEIIEGTQDGLISFVLFGSLVLALGVAGASKSLTDPKPTNADNVAAAVFGPLGNASQFLRFQPVIDASEGMSAVLKLVVDLLGDLGAGAAQLNAN